MIQKLKITLVMLTLSLSLSSFLLPSIASAVLPADQQSGNTVSSSTLGNGCAKDKTAQTCLQKNPIVQDLNIIVNFLSGLVGIVVVGVIILGGIQYSMAGDKADAVSAAKRRIINGLIALLAFLFTYAFLQWLIPGGIFS